MLNKNTLGVKKVRGQSEAALQTGATKTLISVEAKKLLIKIFLNYLNDIQWFTAYFHKYDALSLGHLFHTIIINKGGQVTKPIIFVKICCKPLYVIQVVKKIFDK